MNRFWTHLALLFIRRQNCTRTLSSSPSQSLLTQKNKRERVHISIASPVFFPLFFWAEMEQRKEKLSEFDRFRIIELLKKNKKRKLQGDELSQPKSKQKCCDQSCPSQQVSTFDGGLEAEGKAHLESESEPDSTKDSNIDEQSNEAEEDGFEQFITDEELEELLYSYGLYPNTYTISSATWTIHQETQSGPRKSTIDQEFENYFSMLNL